MKLPKKQIKYPEKLAVCITSEMKETLEYLGQIEGVDVPQFIRETIDEKLKTVISELENAKRD